MDLLNEGAFISAFICGGILFFWSLQAIGEHSDEYYGAGIIMSMIGPVLAFFPIFEFASTMGIGDKGHSESILLKMAVHDFPTKYYLTLIIIFSVLLIAMGIGINKENILRSGNWKLPIILATIVVYFIAALWCAQLIEVVINLLKNSSLGFLYLILGVVYLGLYAFGPGMLLNIYLEEQLAKQ